MSSAEVAEELRESLLTPGDHPVEVPIMCNITRFGLRTPFGLLRSYRDYRTVLRDVRVHRPSGLLKSVFLLESPCAWCSLSLWNGTPAFSAQAPVHVEAARRAFGRLMFDRDRGPELWSTRWQLVSVSNNLQWEDLDLRELIVQLTM